MNGVEGSDLGAEGNGKDYRQDGPGDIVYCRQDLTWSTLAKSVLPTVTIVASSYRQQFVLPSMKLLVKQLVQLLLQPSSYAATYASMSFLEGRLRGGAIMSNFDEEEKSVRGGAIVNSRHYVDTARGRSRELLRLKIGFYASGVVYKVIKSRVRRSQNVDDVPGPSSPDSVTRHHSVLAQALVPITQGASSAASASSSVVETLSWGQGTNCRGPSRGATERRIEAGHKWDVRVIGGYGIDTVKRNMKNRAQQNMTYWRRRMSIYQLRDDFVKTHQREPDRMEIFKMGRCKDHRNGTQRLIDDASSSRFERMTQMTTPAL
ncbi:hypothetical protein Taro_042956 [Colocasia esculenta]|uniref:Uncharacterized protein n=1 Tax=Colocasia esculenta TaxID=4460 RepID=A0A843WJQ9_COLES|nr:hypothetical protein [Colocasia esculenta]